MAPPLPRPPSTPTAGVGYEYVGCFHLTSSGGHGHQHNAAAAAAPSVELRSEHRGGVSSLQECRSFCRGCGAAAFAIQVRSRGSHGHVTVEVSCYCADLPSLPPLPPPPPPAEQPPSSSSSADSAGDSGGASDADDSDDSDGGAAAREPPLLMRGQVADAECDANVGGMCDAPGAVTCGSGTSGSGRRSVYRVTRAWGVAPSPPPVPPPSLPPPSPPPVPRSPPSPPPPPPSPYPPPFHIPHAASVASRVEELNARFRRRPYEVGGWGMLGDAGLLVHVFDGWEDHAEMWHTRQDISTSLLHAGQHNPDAGRQTMPIYHAGSGFIFRPGATPIKCGKAGDSGGHCGGWCPHIDVAAQTRERLGTAWQHKSVNGDGCGGSWHPEDFPAYLRRQEWWQVLNRRLEHNEIIIGAQPWTHALPGLIDAVFVADGSGSSEARDTHRRFLAAYGLSDAQVPLVAINLREWHSPVSAL